MAFYSPFGPLYFRRCVHFVIAVLGSQLRAYNLTAWNNPRQAVTGYRCCQMLFLYAASSGQKQHPLYRRDCVYHTPPICTQVSVNSVVMSSGIKNPR